MISGDSTGRSGSPYHLTPHEPISLLAIRIARALRKQHEWRELHLNADKLALEPKEEPGVWHTRKPEAQGGDPFGGDLDG
jgi:hypothetical protein